MSNKDFFRYEKNPVNDTTACFVCRKTPTHCVWMDSLFYKIYTYPEYEPYYCTSCLIDLIYDVKQNSPEKKISAVDIHLAYFLKCEQ